MSAKINLAKNKPKIIFQSGFSRRSFLAAMLSLLTGLIAPKPCLSKLDMQANDQVLLLADKFSEPQRAVLKAVQLQLFPADGDGPSAADINALAYLEWALTDPDNIEDGDKVFIIKGIGWLEALSQQTHAKSFVKLSMPQQQKMMQTISKSKAGDNWMSLLIYYLLEALLLDSVYGGNPDGIGWQWLGHQPGFPRPTTTKNYRHYLGEPSV